MPTGIGGEKLWLCPSLDDSADDISGNGNHGTYNGGMGTVADTSNGGTRAYSFDGSNDYINLGSVLTGTGDFTISAWFHTNSTSYSYIYGKGVEGNTSDGIGISQQGSFYGAIGNNSTRIVLQNSGSVSTATWYHYAVTFDRDGVATKYVNGIPIGFESIVSAAGNIGSDNDYIGRFGSTTGGFFNGKIDDVRAYDRALTATEITHLATSRGIEGSPYDFNGIGNEIVWLCPTLSATNGAEDLSGNGNHGTVVDASVVADTTSGGTHAYDFQAESHRIEYGRPAEVIASPNDFSVSAWIRPTNSQVDATIWGGYYGLGSHELWSMIRVDRGTLKYWYSDSSGNYASVSGPTITMNTWSHIAVTIDSSNQIEFYRDGTQVGSTLTLSTPSSAPSASVEWWVGQSQRGLVTVFDENFDGKIDDFRWIDRVITQAEITSLSSERGYEPAGGGGGEGEGGNLTFHPFISNHVLD